MKPIISIFASAIRPHLWMNLHKKWTETNSTPFEIIFVGSRKPKFELPNNFKFIYSEVKPAQCFHIASTECQGDYIINFNDDCTNNDGSLDSLINMGKIYDTKNTIISCQYRNNKNEGENMSHYYLGIDSPILPAGGLWSRFLWDKIGGIDVGFFGLYWDADLAMRLKQMGGETVICSDAIFHEIERSRTRNRLYKFGAEHKHKDGHDKSFINELWCIKNDGPRETWKARETRSSEPILYKKNDPDILIRSQGNKGKWK